MSKLQELFDAAFEEAKAAQEAKQTGAPTPNVKSQRQALSEAIVELQLATLRVGDVILDESEQYAESFSDADLAYAGGYLGGLSAIVQRLSQFVRNYPE